MTIEEIQQRIEKAIPDSHALVLDPMNDGHHLQAYVISPVFEGMPVFKQQQMVMAAIKDIFQKVHALGLKTFTPSKWEEVRSQYESYQPPVSAKCNATSAQKITKSPQEKPC